MPDVVCLQELKAEQRAFPTSTLQAMGYHSVWRGERSWNGVAILAREHKPVLTRSSLPGDNTDRQARYIEAAVNGVLITSIYLPNGNPQPGPKFDYKLAWFELRGDKTRHPHARVKRTRQWTRRAAAPEGWDRFRAYDWSPVPLAPPRGRPCRASRARGAAV